MEVFKADHARADAARCGDPLEIITSLLHAAVFVRSRMAEFLERFELTEGRFSVLSALDQAGSQGLSQSEAADQLMQSESNVSSLIERLHRDGLVDRQWSSTDRRKRVLLLTESGQQLIERVKAAMRRWAESLMSDVAQEHRTGLYEGLKTLPVRQVRNSGRRHVEPAGLVIHDGESGAEPGWPGQPAIKGRAADSPHLALEQMLSTLGLVGRFAEDEV